MSLLATFHAVDLHLLYLINQTWSRPWLDPVMERVSESHAAWMYRRVAWESGAAGPGDCAEETASTTKNSKRDSLMPTPEAVRIPGVYRTAQIFCATREQFSRGWCLHNHSGTERDDRKSVNPRPTR